MSLIPVLPSQKKSLKTQGLFFSAFFTLLGGLKGRVRADLCHSIRIVVEVFRY